MCAGAWVCACLLLLASTALAAVRTHNSAAVRADIDLGGGNARAVSTNLFAGTVRVYAAHDHVNVSNARFEALLECDAAALPCRGGALHLPVSVVSRFDLRSGDRVRLRSSLLHADARALLPRAHALVYDVLSEHVSDVELLVRAAPAASVADEQRRKRYAGPQMAVDLRRVVLILLNLGGHALECSRSHVENLFWDGNADGHSVVDIFESTTYGKRTLASDVDADGKQDVIGPYDIDFDSTCNFRSWKEQGDAAADKSGFELSIYQHRIYVLPWFHELSGLCSWRGLGDFGCRSYGTCHVWTLSCNELQTYVHELGHNFDLAHAASFFNEQGNVVEYGDPTAVMGNRWFGQSWISNFNAPHKDASGWFDGTNKAQEIPTGADGVYALAPLDFYSDNTVASQLLKIRHEYTGVQYYFSYNAHSGDGFAMQLLVHSYINHTSPSLFLRALGSGDTFVDFQHRFAVTRGDVNGSVMLVDVQFGCKLRPPEIEILVVNSTSDSGGGGQRRFSNDSSFDVAPGGALEIELRIGNRNSPLCLSSHYTFLPQALAGWASSVDTDHLMLASHQTCSLRWSLVASNASVAAARDSAAVLVLNVTHGEPGSYRDGPLLHTVRVGVRATDECVRAAPTFAVLDAWQQTHHRRATEYLFEIRNHDSLLCAPVRFAVDVQVDGAVWSAAVAADSFEVQSGAALVGSFSLTPARDGDGAVAPANSSSSVTLTLRSLETPAPAAHAAAVTASFAPLLCVAAAPVLRAEPSELMLEARSSTAARVRISNADANCVATEWAFDYTDIPRTMHINLLPATVLLESGQDGSVLVLFTAPTVGVVPLLHTQISVWDLHDTSRNASVVLSLTSYDVPCEVRPPTVTVTCPAHVDVVWQRAFECKVIIDNHDTWPCIRRTFYASVVNVPTQWAWTESMLAWDSPKADTPVDTSYWLTLTVHVPRAFGDRFNGTSGPDALPLDTAWAPLVNITSGATPFGQLYTSDSVYFGACTPTRPTAAIARNDTLVVPLNGSGDIAIDVTNHDGVYCADDGHYEIKVEPATLLASLRGGYGSVDVKRGRTGTGHWRFTAALPGLYNLTLIVASRENATLAADPLQISVRVSDECVLRPPVLTILSPFAPFPPNAALPVRLPNTTYALYAPLRLPPGRALQVNYTVAVTNNDSPGCAESAYRINADFSQLPNPNYYYYHSPPYANAWHVPESIVRVRPNSTATAAVTVQVDESTAPQLYTIGMYINGVHGVHSAAASTSLEISCPPPAAVFNISSSQYTPAFKLERSVLLQWTNPCPNQFQCCCPCSFNVLRDGELIGSISNSLSNFTFNFTDTAVYSGQTSTYSVYVIDRLNRTSAEVDTCSHDITVTVGKADKELFTAFFAGTLTGTVLAIGAFVLLWRFFYRRQRDRYDQKLGRGKYAGKWREALVDTNESTLSRVHANSLSSTDSQPAAAEVVSLRAWKPSPLTSDAAAAAGPPRPIRAAPKPVARAPLAAAQQPAEALAQHDDPLRSATLIDLSNL
jgi:hypothetical protein